MQGRLSDAVVLERYVALVKELGHIPVTGELRVKARTDSSFPSHSIFQRFGSKADLAAKAAEYCRGRSEL